MSSSPFPSFRPSDSVSHLIFLSRLYVSMAGREEQPVSGFSRQVDALSRAMFRKAASEATPLADRLPLLSSLYGLLNGTSYIVDRRKSERWDTLAEELIHAAWAPARAGEEEILTPLCLCLADYFYFDPAPEEDPWFLFLRDTVTRFGEGLASSPHWEGLSLEESLARIGLMNRYSYMFLDHRWDRLVGEASPRPRPSGAVCMTCPPRAMLVRWTNPWRPRLGNASYALLSRTPCRPHRGRTVLNPWWLP